MKANILSSIFLFIMLMLLASGQYGQDAMEILEKMDQVMYGPKDISSKNSIILIDRSGNESTRQATIIQKGNDKRLMRFTAPSSQAGIAVLSLPNDVMYLYLPAFGKERRISTSIKNQNFAGTDFSYDEMESKPYTVKYSATMNGSDDKCYFLELTPKARSDYSKILVKINRVHFYPEQMEFFDKRGKKVKVATYQFEKVGKYWNSSRIEMKDLAKEHKTIMLMSDVKYDTGLTDDEFTVRKLKQ